MEGSSYIRLFLVSHLLVAEQLVKRQEPGGEVTSPEDSAGDDTTNSEENSGDR